MALCGHSADITERFYANTLSTIIRCKICIAADNNVRFDKKVLGPFKLLVIKIVDKINIYQASKLFVNLSILRHETPRSGELHFHAYFLRVTTFPRNFAFEPTMSRTRIRTKNSSYVAFSQMVSLMYPQKQFTASSNFVRRFRNCSMDDVSLDGEIVRYVAKDSLNYY